MKNKTTRKTTSNTFTKKELSQIVKVTKGIESAVMKEIKTTEDVKLLKGIEKTSLLIQKKQSKILDLVSKRINQLGYH